MLMLFAAVSLSRCHSSMYPLARRSPSPQSQGLQGRRGPLEALALRVFQVYRARQEQRCGILRLSKFARLASDDNTQGSQGPPGLIGSTGPQGIQGVQGPVGATVTHMAFDENCAPRSNEGNREAKGLQAPRGALERKVSKVFKVNKASRAYKAYKEQR